jgi:hypothetical protein
MLIFLFSFYQNLFSPTKNYPSKDTKKPSKKFGINKTIFNLNISASLLNSSDLKKKEVHLYNY